MSRNDSFEGLLTDFLEDAPDRASDSLLQTILTGLLMAPQRSGWRSVLRRWIVFRSNSFRYAAVAGVGIVAAAIAIGAWAGSRDGVGGPSPTASTSSQPSASQEPPASTGSPAPSSSLQTPGSTGAPSPLLWHPGAWLADWPAPLRVEPADGSFTVTRPPRGADLYPLLTDLTGDAGESAPAWLDITSVHIRPDSNAQRIRLNLAGSTAVPTPADAWIAYGIVLDTDGDGRADIRVGIDNVRSASRHRAWITNLRTSETSANLGPGAGAFGVDVDTWYIDSAVGGDGVVGTVAQITVYKPDRLAFYAWTGLIVDGVLVGTDYAPDAGWIESATLGAAPTTTP